MTLKVTKSIISWKLLMPNTNRYNTIRLDNLKSLEAFRMWIKENLPNLYRNKKIPDEHLLIFLSYIKRVMSEAEEIDKSFWLSLVRQLESNLKSINRVEE